jgi:YVTN family beta-propeller protein
MHTSRFLRTALFTVAVSLLAATDGSSTGYRLAGKYTIGGDAGWDYISIDSAARRLFVSHVTQVDVADADSGKVTGHITNTPGVHGIALATSLGKAFTSNGKADTVSVVDLKSLAHLAELKTGKKPDAIVFDPGTGTVIVANGESDSLTIIDAAASKVVATIPVGGAPEYITTDLKGTAWVNLEDKDSFVTIDLKTYKVKNTTPLEGCKAPSAMAIDRGKGRLFIGCANNLMVIVDSASRKIVARLPIGEHVDAATFDPDAGLAFASTGDGNITIVKENAAGQYEVAEVVKTMRGAKTMVLDPKTKKIFLPTVEGVPVTATGPPKPTGPGAYKAGAFVVLVVAR